MSRTKVGRAKIENDMQRDRKIIEQLTMLSLTCEGMRITMRWRDLKRNATRVATERSE